MGEQAVVVGGGAIGVACAHYLADSGFQVTLLDRAEVGRGCSYANAGLIVPSHSQPLPGPGIVREGLRHLTRRDGAFTIRPRPELVPWLWTFRRSCGEEAFRRGTEALLALSRASLELYEELAREGRADFGYRRGPLLHVYLSEQWRDRARGDAADIEAFGFPARVADRDELLDLEPALGPAVRGGILIEGQASGDSFAYVRSLAAGLAGRGVRIVENRPVRRILVGGGRVQGVLADGEELGADVVVLAAGAWTPALAAPLGLRLPIEPATGYSCTVASFSGAPRLPIMVEERHVAVTPLGDRVRFGGTLELAGFRTSPDRVRYDAVVRAGREALAGPVPLEREEAWYGFRPLTPDDLPVIGWAPKVEGLIVAAGHGTLGFTQSPITGKLVAELASGRPPSVELEPFRPDRF